jgi:thiamine pyrophosphate-dependent acetolactate synthase large subunit-like protein
MLVKQAIIEFFIKNDIQYIFQIPGLHTLPLNAALTDHKNIRIITGRHESNVIFMADGYARTSGKPGIIIVTPGPGLGNIVSGCMEAFNDDVPLLVIHIDIERKDIDKGILHGVAEPEIIFRHITKKTYFVDDIRILTALLNDAYQETSSGRKGPVLVSIPHTFFEKDIPSGLSSTKKGPEYSQAITTDHEKDDLDSFLDKLSTLLSNKKKPVMIGGKALMEQGTGLLMNNICRTSAIPFLTTTGGKGIVREDGPYAFGNVIRKGVVQDILTSSDLVIAIGTRLRDVDAKRRGVRIDELVHIDIDNQWIGKNYPAQLKFAGNIEEALSGIQSLLNKRQFEWDMKALKSLQIKEEAALRNSSSEYAIIHTLRKVIPEDTLVVCDLNIPSYWSEYYFPVYYQKGFLMPRGISPIFYSFPASIGAKLGAPERPCIALCGDGGLLPSIGEMATIKAYNIPIVIFLHNNSSFAILEDIMADRYDIHNSMDLTNPDFVKIARAFDIKAKRTKTLKGLEEIFRNDVTWEEPILIEFVHPVSRPPWRF